jgi:hypothetical protein
MGSCCEARLTEDEELETMPEKILSRSALDRYLPIWRVAPARRIRSVVTVSEPPHGFLLISDRVRCA